MAGLKSRKSLGFGFAVVAGVLVMASAAYACTIYKGKMTVTVGGTTSTADGNQGSMTHCVDPRLTADLVPPDTGHGSVAVFNGLNTQMPNGAATMTVNISTGKATECNTTGNFLPDGPYYVSYHADFGIDCMVQGGGTPQFIHPNKYVIAGGAGAGNPAVQAFNNIPAYGEGYIHNAPPPPDSGYAGICLTQDLLNRGGDTGVLKGNKVPVKVI